MINQAPELETVLGGIHWIMFSFPIVSNTVVLDVDIDHISRGNKDRQKLCGLIFTCFSINMNTTSATCTHSASSTLAKRNRMSNRSLVVSSLTSNSYVRSPHEGPLPVGPCVELISELPSEILTEVTVIEEE